MQLICRYDTEFPRVVGHVPDGDQIDMARPDMRGLVLVPFPGDMIEQVVRAYGKAGPEPELMGDPPTECHPDHAELDKHDIPDHVLEPSGKVKLDPKTGAPVPHPLRLVAGKPYADNRRRAEDLRPPAAPPQSDPGVLRAYLAQQRWLRETGGLVVLLAVERSGEQIRLPVSTTRESQSLIETSALRAARRSDVEIRFKDADDVVRLLTADQMIHAADAVYDHTAKLRDAEDRVRGLVDSGAVSTFAQIDQELGS